MRRLEAACTAANTHTRYGVQIMILHSSGRVSAGRWPGTPIIRLETKGGRSDPPMLTPRTGLGSCRPRNTSLRGLIGIDYSGRVDAAAEPKAAARDGPAAAADGRPAR
jgi:hypothetical protein